MKQPSALTTLNSLSASQAAKQAALQSVSQAKNSAPASEAAQPFGQLLSREMENRQNASRVEAPAAPEPAARERAATSQPLQATNQGTKQATNQATTSATNQDAAGLRARQEAQRSQDRRDVQERQEQRDGATTTDTDQASAANAASGAPNNGAGAAASAAAPATKTDAPDDKADAASDTASLADQATAPVSSAGAALQALLASLAPKAAAPAAATADVAIDPKVAGARIAAPVMSAATAKPDAADAALAHDPAFDALLAQAAQLSQARDGSKQAAPGRGLPLADLQNGAAAGGDAVPVNLPAVGAFAAKVDASIAAATVPTALLHKENDPLAALPGATAAVGTGILQATGAAAANGTDTLAPRVGTPAWDHALGQKVVWMAAGAEQTASLTLNPPDLGPVQVVINVSNSQADASFTAAQPEVRQALEAAMPKLKEMLADAGISLGQTSVGAGSPNQHGAADRQQAAATRRSAAGAQPGEEAAVAVAQPTARRITGSGNGLVNTFA